ncbi:MAG: thiolase family protein [Chloroflexi bacterium]|nr:thiolase family protein [Chloroflexota bacterium]
MQNVYVLGTGLAKFGKRDDVWLEELGREAGEAALIDSCLARTQIDMAFCGHAFGGRVVGQRLLAQLGLSGIPTINVENACTTGATAFHLAYQAVAHGDAELVLVIGLDQMASGLIDATKSDFEGALGRTLPGKYALRANRYIALHDLTVNDLADIVVKNRAFGAQNSIAHFQEAVTREEVLGSRMIAEPLTLFQCCPSVDGAAAALIGTEKLAKQIGKPLVKIFASALGAGKYIPSSEGKSPDDELVRATAQKAYAMAGCGPEDIQVAEVHDAFSIGEVLAYDNLGFCKPGEAARLIRDRVTWLGGKLPVSTSGGLLSRGHPLGATGMAQIVEITRQLRSESGSRQIDPLPKLGLAQCTGGAIPVVGTASCCVHILGR